MPEWEREAIVSVAEDMGAHWGIATLTAAIQRDAAQAGEGEGCK